MGACLGWGEIEDGVGVVDYLTKIGEFNVCIVR